MLNITGGCDDDSSDILIYQPEHFLFDIISVHNGDGLNHMQGTTSSIRMNQRSAVLITKH